jgi:tRNA(fMet)-specific endonuclease VapC
VGILIDASVLIGIERATSLEQRLSGREDDEFFVSVVTASELLHGVHRARSADIRARRSAFVEAVLSRFPLLAIDLPTARAHAQLWADLASRGAMIGTHDLWIAAACVAHGLSLATRNAREFERVPGLTTEVWLSS